MAALDLPGLFRGALAELAAGRLVQRALGARALRLEPLPGGRLVVFALGKAAPEMAEGALRSLPFPVAGVVASHRPAALPGLRPALGAHPVPDATSLEAGRALLAAAAGLTEVDSALYLVSGGGSAIAVAPAPGLSLEDKAASTRALLASGATIEETNAVRKHLSLLKGGQLAASALAGRAAALVLCDVPSGELSAVASGPTLPDPTTFGDCVGLVRRLRVALPPRALARLEAGARGELPETPKPGDARLAAIDHVRLAEPSDLARTAERLARARGFACEIDPSAYAGPLEGLAARIEARVRSALGARAARGSVLFAWCGEPTLRVPRPSGAGGRMQHLALLLARSLGGLPFRALCAGSDGKDGDSPHAGALVDGATRARAAAAGIDLDRALARFDSATACRALGVAIPAFDSGTNLCDLVLVELGARAAASSAAAPERPEDR